MNLKEIARRFWRSFEAVADAVDYDPVADIARRVDRLERAVADLGKTSGSST